MPVKKAQRKKRPAPLDVVFEPHLPIPRDIERIIEAIAGLHRGLHSGWLPKRADGVQIFRCSTSSAYVQFAQGLVSLVRLLEPHFSPVFVRADGSATVSGWEGDEIPEALNLLHRVLVDLINRFDLEGCLRVPPTMPTNRPHDDHWLSLEEDEGILTAKGMLERNLAHWKEQNPGEAVIQVLSHGKPRFDTERGELWYGGGVVKRIRQEAPNLRLLLRSFDDAGWPRRIDNPLSTNDKLAEAVRQMRDTPHLLFERDGTGGGVCWSPGVRAEPQPL